MLPAFKSVGHRYETMGRRSGFWHKFAMAELFPQTAGAGLGWAGGMLQYVLLTLTLTLTCFSDRIYSKLQDRPPTKLPDFQNFKTFSFCLYPASHTFGVPAKWSQLQNHNSRKATKSLSQQ